MLRETLLAAIYAIATEEGAFARASAQIAQDMGYRHGLLSLQSHSGPIELALNQPEVLTTGYLEHYHKLDPWAGLAARARHGEPFVTAPEAVQHYLDTEFYVDFAYPIGMVDPLGIKMRIGGGLDLMVGLNQALHSDRPTAADELAITEIAHHLQRAVQLRQRLRGVLQEKASLLSALDRVAFGMAVTSADGKVHALNAAGEQAMLAGCGLQVRHGFLVPSETTKAGELALLIRQACTGGAGGALRLRAGLNEYANVLIAPLPQGSDWAGSAARSLVAFRVAGAPTQLNAHLLMSAFGLSRGEAQVAVALMEGRTSDEIALARGVKPTTIKSQLQAIFLKTGTKSQRELVRYLSSLPPVTVG